MLPDFAVGQVVLHDEPETVPSTVATSPVTILATSVLDVEVLDRRLMLEQAGTAVLTAGGGGGVTVLVDAFSTPAAAYRTLIPYRLLTAVPLIAVTTYHELPLFQSGQYVPHEAPETLPDTVSVAPVFSFDLIVADVDALVRRFTPSQAGVMVCVAAWAGVVATDPNTKSATSAMTVAVRNERTVVDRVARSRDVMTGSLRGGTGQTTTE